MLDSRAAYSELENTSSEEWQASLCLTESLSRILRECTGPEVQCIGGFTPETATALGQLLVIGLLQSQLHNFDKPANNCIGYLNLRKCPPSLNYFRMPKKAIKLVYA